MSLAIMQTQAAANDASITLKKDPGTGLFTLTIKDPDGIQEFSMTPTGKLPYGGGLSGCPATFSITNTNFDASGDFEPVMKAYVLDCQNNTANLEIAPPKDGLAKSKSLEKAEPPPPSPSAPAKEPTEEKKGGPLSASDIAYPVKELGNCQSDIECRSYCDNADRAKACFTFAKKYHLISEEEADEAADKFLNVKNGPGGCNSGSSCETYCNSVDHLDACIAFAEETGYYSPEELAEARKFQALVKAGTQFPGGCKDRNTCEIYCSDSGHMEECLDFAEESGFMPKEEIDEARKFMALMRQGESPGGCTSKEQCENYCFEENHIDECIAFAEKAGVITAEDAIMAKKVGGKGPGGCRSKVQCETYCEANSEECFNFAQEHGLISEDDLAEMRDGMARFRDELDKMPPEAVQCMKDAAGEENFNKMIAGEPIFDRGIEGKMKSCFGQITAQFSKQFDQLPPEAAQCIRDAIGEEGFEKLQSGELDENFDFKPLEACFQKLQGSFGGGSNFSGGGFSGPGGCKNTQECTAYCQEHLDECKGFGPPGGGDTGGGFPSGGTTGGGFSGPGGCTSKEECQAYCQEHPDECKNFAPPGGGGFPGGGATGGQFPGGGTTGGGFPGGPGGCTSREECQAYCQAHPAECGGGGGALPPPLTSSCIVPPSGLISWWSADLASGTNVPDITKNNNGTISGGVTIIPMEVGDAFGFDGSSGRISIGNSASLNFGTESFSLEAWFNWNGGGGTAANNIIRKSNYGPGAGSGYWLRVGAGKLEFSVGATTQAEGQSIIVAPISTGIWHHVVGVKDRSGDVKLYVDGKSVGTVLRQATVTESTSEFPFTIGAWEGYPGGPREFWNGEIDDVAVYNRALSAEEARSLFDAGSIGKCATSFGRTNRELPNYSGPGGCTNEAECKAYCAEHSQDPACQQFAPPPTFSIPPQPSPSAGPGGCTNPTECTAYCTKNYTDPACQQFGPGSQAEPLNQGFFARILSAFGPILGIR